MIQLDTSILHDVGAASQLEWLETNGLGGFAMSTPIGMNTRKYHGLLVAATRPPAERRLLLAKLEEVLFLRPAGDAGGEQKYELSCNQYPGIVFPHSYALQTSFRMDPFPTFTFDCGGVIVEKTVFLAHGENTVCIEYTFSGDAVKLKGAKLEIRPLITARNYHDVARMSADFNRDVTETDGILVMQPYPGIPALKMAHNASRVSMGGDWYNAFTYLVEKERGYDHVEDLFNPFTLKFDLDVVLAAGETACKIIASTEARPISRLPELRQTELARRAAAASAAPPTHPSLAGLAKTMALAADQFIVTRGDGFSIIAGYPWFTDWGRDSMVALPGLALTTGRVEVARSILRVFAAAMSDGMIPNRFLDNSDLAEGAKVEYNTIDGTLWMFEATRALLAKTNDAEFVRQHIYPALKEALAWHIKGARHHIHMDEDGLLSGGEEGFQLTWMDAKVNNWVVTPRYGKPVEIQALWFNALRILADLAAQFGDEATREQCAELAGRAQTSFNALFWNESAGCLYDVISNDGPDGAMRPNQLLAVSLHHAILTDPDRARRVVEAVERDLLTPFGLRSLAASDYNYRGRCEGNTISRDSAYHQGTVWAWLIGPFIGAYLKVNGRSERSLKQARRWLKGFEDCLETFGLGQVAEVFDGDPPHKGRGCIAQAWSVAELLRLMEEVA